MNEPKLYTGPLNEYPMLPVAPREVADQLFSFLPPPNRWVSGSGEAFHRYLLTYWRALRERGIRFQRLGDHCIETQDGPRGYTIKRTRRYCAWSVDGWELGKVLVATLQSGRVVRIVNVQAPAEVWP